MNTGYDVIVFTLHWLIIIVAAVVMSMPLGILNKKLNFLLRGMCPVVIGLFGLILVAVHENIILAKTVIISECLLAIMIGIFFTYCVFRQGFSSRK